MELMPAGSRPSRQAPADYFTGTVRQDAIWEAPAPARMRAVCVTFEPGARTAWHTHPLGQTLHITSGVGLVQKWGEAAILLRPGDTVWIAPGEKHWHGAAPETALCHIAIHEALNDSYVEWLEHVTDEHYGAARCS